MRLLNITLSNFRRYEDARFQFHPRFTVLTGENGKGKTTVLDAVAVMLGTCFKNSKIRTGQNVLRKTDARLVMHEIGGQVYFEDRHSVDGKVDYSHVYIEAEAVIHDANVVWQRFVGTKAFGVPGVNILKNALNYDASLPLLLYYGVGRLWTVQQLIPTEKPGSRLDAYQNCLNPKSDQKAFEQWFKSLTYAELQKHQALPSLIAVKQAVLTCIPDAEEFYFDTLQDQILIKLKQEGVVPFNNLSDGYRNIIAMVADIAYRAVRLNPHLEIEAAKKTEGIILIDEIDLHLHPKWQRKIVRDLQQAFPKLQFIASTHSPFILQSLEPGEVIDLNRIPLLSDTENISPGIAAPGPADQYSNRSIEDIVQDVMGVDVPQRSERYQKMYEAAKNYYQVLQDAKDTPPDIQQRLKTQLDEFSAPFSDNVAYHAFLEMERMAAGLGKSEKKREEHN